MIGRKNNNIGGGKMSTKKRIERMMTKKNMLNILKKSGILSRKHTYICGGITLMGKYGLAILGKNSYGGSYMSKCQAVIIADTSGKTASVFELDKFGRLDISSPTIISTQITKGISGGLIQISIIILNRHGYLDRRSQISIMIQANIQRTKKGFKIKYRPESRFFTCYENENERLNTDTAFKEKLRLPQKGEYLKELPDWGATMVL